MTTVIGIDPGLTGAIAFLFDGKPFVIDMPTVGKDVCPAGLASELSAQLAEGRLHAYVEQASSRPGQGVSSVFRYGKGYGTVIGVLAALFIPYSLVTPAKWKRAVGLPSGADKEASRALALRLFPELANDLKRKKDHGRAEALLIAHSQNERAR